MASSSKDMRIPRSSRTSGRRRRQLSRSRRNRGGGEYPEIATRLQNSSNRCLKAAGLSNERLELISLNDFKPLYSSGDNTLAGQMFDLRLTQRDSDIEAVKIALQDLEQNFPDEFTAALAQYDSALVATESDIALIKMMILLKTYSTHTARFLSFLDEYSIESLEEKLNVDFLGSNVISMLTHACGRNVSKQSKNASLIFGQIPFAINAATSGLSPYYSSGKISSPDSKVRTQYKFGSRANTPYKDFAFDIGKLSRDLTFSREIVKIKNDLEPDEEFKQTIFDVFGESWVNSTQPQDGVVISKFTGSTASTSGIYTKKNVEDIGNSKFKDLLNYSNSGGLFDAIFYGRKILPLESKAQTYKKGTSTKSFESIDSIVDDAFSGQEILDFTEFNEAIDDVVDRTRELVNFSKVGFRILDAVEDAGDPRGFPVASSEPPLSSVAITSVCMDTFNRRCASVMGSALYKKITNWMTPEHVMYNKMFAWLLLRDNPDLCVIVIDQFLDDYETGWLTAASQPGPIEGTAEVDGDGNEIAGTEEISAVQHVLPGTNTVVSKVGKSPAANSNNGRLARYFSESVRQMRPLSVLSYNNNENVDEPFIRVNWDRTASELHKYFGDPNPEQSEEGDLRLINPMSAIQDYIHYGNDTQSTSNRYYGVKLVQAELIDTFIEILRLLVDPFDPVEPVAEGDPVFPFIEGDIASPYTKGPWNWSTGGYEAFQREMWVPTIAKFKDVFLRNSDTTYLYNRNLYDRRGITSSIVGVLSSLMQTLDMVELRKETTDEAIVVDTGAAWSKKQLLTCLTIGLKDTPDSDASSGTAIDGNPPPPPHPSALDDPPPPPAPTSTATSGGTTAALLNAAVANTAVTSGLTGNLLFKLGTSYDGCSTFFKSELPGCVGFVLDQTDLPVSGDQEGQDGRIKNELAEFLNSAYKNDAAFIFLIDFLEKFADRVDGYRNAVLDLVEGEGTAIGELITNLREIGNAGEDVLQNITTNQLALKQIALEEEKGDESNAYLPNLSVLTRGEANVVKLLCQENILKSPEGDTTKTVVVGIPAGTFEKLDIDSEFCLRVTYIDVEYPQLVFRPKSYKFDKDLYVLPEDFEISSNIRSFDRALRSMKFSKLRVEVVESSDASPVITLEDDVEKKRYSTSKPDVYSNLAVSEALKIYYRVLLGVNFSESAFPSEPGGISLEISEAAADLAGSMASNVETIATFSEGLAENITDVLSDITKFDDPDSFVSGEITAVDEALLTGLKNAYQTRVFSPDVLRSRTISAKMFDRIYVLPIDPDEFYIVPPTSEDAAKTPEAIFDFYLNAGIIEETGLDAPHSYKLAPRRAAEGSMALGKASVMLTTVSPDTERLLDL